MNEGGRRMKRREFLQAGVAAVAGAVWPDAVSGAPPGPRTSAPPSARGRFRLKHAPHFGMFKHSAGDRLIDQLKFAADQGFVAWQDNGLTSRPVEVQERIGRTLAALDMEMGAFRASTAFEEVRFERPGDPAWQRVLRDFRDSVEVAWAP